MLPTAGSQADNKSGSFQNMLSKYGLASAVSAGSYNIAAAPLYFVRSGRINMTITTGVLGSAGQSSFVWSSRGSSTHYDGVAAPSAYDFSFNATDVHPSHGPYQRYYGRSLRCLSTVLDI